MVPAYAEMPAAPEPAAEVEAAAAADAAVLENITVYAPIRDSQAAALDQQRKADNLVSIIASDTVGRFPDQNSAAALARLPAVAVQRDQGQERYIQVRGAPNRWTSVSFDGVPVIGTDEGSKFRAFRFDAVPAVILNSLAVNKSLTPDLPAEAVVAQVDLRTASAFDKKGITVQGDLGYGVMGLGDGDQRQGSLRASWSNDSFGVIVGLSHYRRDQTTDNREFSYDDKDIIKSYDIRNYLVQRQNNAGFVGLEFRPSDEDYLFAKALYSEFKDAEQRNQYTFQLGNALSGTRGATSGSLVGVPVRSSAEDGDYATRNYINTIGGEHKRGDWKLDWRLNYSRAENESSLPILMQNQVGNPTNRVSMDYDLSNPNFPIAQLYSTVAGATAGTYQRGAALTALNQSAFNYNLMMPISADITSDSWTFKGDLSRVVGDWTYKIGAQVDDRKIKGNLMDTSRMVALSTLLPRIGMSDLVAGDYVTDKPWNTGFPSGFTVNYLDNKQLGKDMAEKLAALQAAGLYNPAANVNASNIFDISERLYAGYAMAKREFDRGQVVFGLRVEHMELGVDGFLGAGGVYTPINAKQSYTDFFPSVNVKYDVTDDVVGRLSFQRGISRPSFASVRAGAAISDTSTPGTISGGNPYLEPEYTWGSDASLEYYIAKDSVVSVSGFYRWVDNVFHDSKTRVTDDSYDTGGFDRTGYDFITTLNGGKGKLYGVEFAYLQQWSFLPSPFDGLGFQGNIAFLSGSFDTAERKNAPFPGTSKTVANASLFYEKYGVSARISYQWRSNWADTLGGLGLGEGGDEYRKAYGNLDLSLRYAVNDNVTLYADLTNLTDETYIAYSGDLAHPSEVEQVGRRYMGGLRFSF